VNPVRGGRSVDPVMPARSPGAVQHAVTAAAPAEADGCAGGQSHGDNYSDSDDDDERRHGRHDEDQILSRVVSAADVDVDGRRRRR